MVSVVAEKCFDHIDLGRFRISDTEAGGILADVAGVAGCGRLVFGLVLEGRLTTGTRLPLTPSPSPRSTEARGAEIFERCWLLLLWGCSKNRWLAPFRSQEWVASGGVRVGWMGRL